MMRFLETPLPGAYVIELEPHLDERGSFARRFCRREFQERGLIPVFVQSSVSATHRRATVRGLHFQMSPACEAKLLWCAVGAIFDVIVDLRPDSPTYRRHFSVELDARNRLSLYVPEMFAHGFQTLEDETEVCYQISEFYAADLQAGVRFDDPMLAIQWPLPVSVISERDLSWPLLIDDGRERASHA